MSDNIALLQKRFIPVVSGGEKRRAPLYRFWAWYIVKILQSIALFAHKLLRGSIYCQENLTSLFQPVIGDGLLNIGNSEGREAPSTRRLDRMSCEAQYCPTL